MTGLKASVTLTPWRLFLDEFHRQRPLVVLKADIEKWALQDGPLAAGDPPLRADSLETGEHLQKVRRKALQNVLLFQFRGKVIIEPSAIRQFFIVQIPHQAGLRAVIRRGVCPAEYMEIIIVNIVQALVAAKHTAIPAPHCYPSIDANSSK